MNYTYKNKLDKTCFANDASYFNDKDLAKRTISDKILKDGAINFYEIAKNPKCDRYQRALASIVYKYFD